MLTTNFSLKALLVALIFTLSNITYAGTSKIGVIVFEGVLTSDITAPIEVFGAASKTEWFSSHEVLVISSTAQKTITTEEGLKIVADTTIYDNLQLDVVLVASAYEMDPHLNNKDLITFIQKQAKQASWMASNCSGASLLGKAGVLDGKKATTWAGGEKELATTYPQVNVQYDQNVVIDHKLITSNGGPVSYQAAFDLLAKMSTPEHAQEISESIQFNRLESAFRKGWKKGGRSNERNSQR